LAAAGVVPKVHGLADASARSLAPAACQRDNESSPRRATPAGPATLRGSTIRPLSWIKPSKCGEAPERLAEEQMRKHLGLLLALFLVAGVTLAQQGRQQDYSSRG